MAYGKTIRFLARAFYQDGAPSITTARVMARAAAILENDDLHVSAATNLSATTGRMSQAMVLASRDGAWRLTSHHESIDFEFVPPTHVADGNAFPIFCDRAATLLGSIVTESESRAHRMACVREGLLPDMSSVELQMLASRLLNYPSMFAPAPWEWDWRCVTTIERKIRDTQEPTNTLITAKRLAGTIVSTGEAFDSVRVDFDLNTSPKTTTPRFDGADVSAFFKASLQWHNSLERDFLAFVNKEADS